MTQPILVEQNEALLAFLDDLLTEEAPMEAAEAGPAAAVPEQAADIPEDVPPAVGHTEAEAPTGAQSPAPMPEAADPDTGRIPIIPPWAAGIFQAMVFKVGELALAVPLVELAGVLEWKPEQAGLAVDPGLCWGECTHAGRSVKLIDTSQLVLPQAHQAALRSRGAGSKISRIILINEGNIGLLCDEVFEVISISPDRVSWRSKRTRRKWLAGTMLEELIVVLDPRTTVELITETLNSPG